MNNASLSYKRIDILPSSRKITVQIDGQTVAESNAAMFLQETTLPMRYYLPKTSVRLCKDAHEGSRDLLTIILLTAELGADHPQQHNNPVPL